MKKSVKVSFIKYILSLFFVLLLLFLCFAYWALHSNMPKESLLEVNKLEKPIIYEPKEQIKIVSYNIGHGQGIKENAWDRRELHVTNSQLALISESMKEMDADIFLLQEVDIDSHRTQRINQIEFLQNTLKYPYYACANVWEKNYIPFPYWPVSDHIGYVRAAQCILSKYPLSNHERIIFDKPASNPFWYNWGYIDRGLQKVDVQIGEHKVAVINLHLEAWGKDTRAEQIKVVHEYMHKLNYPIILGGDFNTVPSDAMKKSHFGDDDDDDYEDEETFVWFLKNNPQLQAEFFTETDKVHFSFPSDKPNRLLDHIFIKDLKYLDFTIQDKAGIASDHLPVMAIVGF